MLHLCVCPFTLTESLNIQVACPEPKDKALLQDRLQQGFVSLIEAVASRHFGGS